MPGLLGGLGLKGITAGAGLLKKGVQGLTNLLGKGKNLQGLVGGAMMHRGMQGLDSAYRPQSEEDLRSPFQNTQNIINRLTDWNQFSGTAADDSLAAGDQAVRTAQMMGPMGGSASQAIKNRMKTAQDSDRYDAWLQNSAAMIDKQQGIDQNIFSAMQGQRLGQQNWLDRKYSGMGQMGSDLLAESGISTGSVFDKGADVLGGLLKKIPGIS